MVRCEDVRYIGYYMFLVPEIQTRLQFPPSLSKESANPRLALTGERERMHFQLQPAQCLE